MLADEAHDEPGAVLRASLWGATTPWNLLVVTALGVWLLAAPAVFDVDITSGAADVAHLGGAFVVVAAVIAWGEPVRALRVLCIPAGLAVAVLSLPRGQLRERYGDWELLTR